MMTASARPWKSRSGCILLALIASTNALAQARKQAQSVAEGKHFRLVCHFKNSKIAKQALAMVEAVWQPGLAVLGAKVSHAKQPLLAVHLYPNAKAYQAAEENLTGGRFKRNLAFAHFDSKSAHVAMQPELSKSFLEARGLNYQTLRLLAHEAAHLLRYRTTPNYRSHPGWYADGSASWLEAKLLRSTGHITSLASDPHFSDLMLRGQNLLKKGKLPTLTQILRSETSQLAFYDRYAVHWLLFDYLYTNENKTMQWWIATLRRQGGGKHLGQRLADMLRSKLGRKNYARLEKRFVAHVKALQPQWQEVFRSLETAPDAWYVTAFRNRNAIAWQTQDAGKKSWSLSGSFKIFPSKNAQLNILLDRRSCGFVMLAFNAGTGVTLFRYTVNDDRWDRLAFAKAKGLVADKLVAFRVRVAKQRLSLNLGAKQVLDFKLERPCSGPWGLGALAASAGMWQKLEFER